MNETTYKNAMAFLNRVDLKGAEVDAMVDVRNAIIRAYESSLPKEHVPEVPEKNISKNAKES